MSARLPQSWEEFIQPQLELNAFYRKLDLFCGRFPLLLPKVPLIFNVFTYMAPGDVRCVLYGEDPYPRAASACGVAFWDKEIESWDQRTNGNSMKNMFKALLVVRGLVRYDTPIGTCREIAEQSNFPAPDALFLKWLNNGILLVNTALTFSGTADKKEHLAFWKPFHLALIKAFAASGSKPHFILWGKKAQQWETAILQADVPQEKIIKQGHPTFIHQFMDKARPQWSPFDEIEQRTKMRWS